MKKLLFTALVAAFIGACQSPKQKNTTATPTAAPLASGTLLEAGDAGYPLGYLTLMITGDTAKQYFDINYEEVPGGSMDQMRLKVGKEITLAYSKENLPTMVDVQVEGKSIFPFEPVEIQPFTKKIEGVLSGADQVTSGDLPSKISIKAPDGAILDMDYFVTPELMAYNGKKVICYYEMQERNIVKAIK